MDQSDSDPTDPPVLLRVVGSGESLEAAIRVLASASRPEAYVRSWCAEGRVFALGDVDASPGDLPVGAVLALPVGAGRTVELRVVAVLPATGRKGVGRRLLAEVADALRSEGVRRLVAGTSNAELGLMTLLQEAGFRTAHVEQDACTAEQGWIRGVGDSGLSHRDLIWFEQDL